MEPLIDVAGLITRTPGGAMGIFVIAPAVLAEERHDGTVN